MSSLITSTTTIEPMQSSEEFKSIWPFFKEIVAKGDTYNFPPDISYEDALALWIHTNGTTYIAWQEAEEKRSAVGSFYLKPNHPGLGSHVANAGYMVNPDYHGQGIGRALGQFSMTEAKRLGYQAIQFNFVVSTNTVAVKLWESLGFNIIGTVPKGFQHKTLGFVDSYIMHRFV